MLLVAVLTLACIVPRPARADDQAEFSKMLSLFERAVNENNFELIKPFIDSSFKGSSIAGTDMSGAEQIQAFMNAARFIMGPGAKYHLKLIANQTEIAGDRARAMGTTEEEITLADGKKLKYKENWGVQFTKKDGKRLATKADAKADLKDRLTVAAHVIASRVWNGGLDLRDVRAAPPDFDQDNGSHEATGDESIPPPTKGKK